MAKFGLVQNGLRKKANGTKRKANPLSLAKVQGFLKKNGLKSVKRGAVVAIANPKRRKGRKRRNGLESAKSFSMTRRNGLLGNTKQQAKDVAGLLGGMLGGKAVGRVLNNFASPYLAQMGLGGYSEIISDGVVALIIAPLVGGKVGGANTAKFVALGAMANVAVDIVELVAPNTLSFFGSNALVSNGQQVGLSPAAVTAIVNSTNAPIADKAKVAGAMAQIEAGALPQYSGGYTSAPVGMLYD